MKVIMIIATNYIVMTHVSQLKISSINQHHLHSLNTIKITILNRTITATATIDHFIHKNYSKQYSRLNLNIYLQIAIIIIKHYKINISKNLIN